MRKQTKLWTTRDGRRIRICDMSDEHLLNVVKLLQRFAEATRITTVNLYVNTPGPQGDMAQYLFEQEFDAVLDSTYEDYLPEIFDNIELEVKRRGLEMPPKQPERLDLEVALIAKTAGITLERVKQ